MNKKIKIVCLALCAGLSLGLGSLSMLNTKKADASAELIVPQEYNIKEQSSRIVELYQNIDRGGNK